MSKLTCLHRPKSGDGDKVSIDGYFDGDKVSFDGYFDGDKLEMCLS